jgi:hypothetical protein
MMMTQPCPAHRDLLNLNIQIAVSLDEFTQTQNKHVETNFAENDITATRALSSHSSYDIITRIKTK